MAEPTLSVPGHELLSGQLYFPGGPHNADNIAGAVKPELMLDPQPGPNWSETVSYRLAGADRAGRPGEVVTNCISCGRR